jgi:hypothetical protein
MGLFKEADYFFKEYAQRQNRIYDDACDEGILVTGLDDPLCIKLKEIFNDTGGWKGFMSGIKKHRTMQLDNNDLLLYATVVVYLPWETSEGNDNELRCTKWTVTYNSDRRNKKLFVSFSARQACVAYNEVWETGV